LQKNEFGRYGFVQHFVEVKNFNRILSESWSSSFRDCYCRIENKDIFIDLRSNSSGKYIKLSERRGKFRKTVLIPASGITKLQAALQQVANHVNEADVSESKPATARYVVSLNAVNWRERRGGGN
jgi:hypothetical protein